MTSTGTRRFDVVIVGAGPAGSSAACVLASAGLDVALLDKAQFPRDKLCGGLLSQRSLRNIEHVFGRACCPSNARQRLRRCSSRTRSQSGFAT